MKKFTLSALCLLFVAATACAQGVYQFPNADFEEWTSYDEGNAVPELWHTFNTMQCDLGYFSCLVAKNNHSNRVTRDGGGYALQIYAKSVLGNIANGAMTTGRTRVGSTTPSSIENYNYDPEGYRWSFHGRPDSISFYARSSGGISGNALFKVFIHDGNTFQDKADGSLSGTSYGSMIYAFHPTSSWGRFVKEVSWTNTTATPQLILGSFSTNEAAGAGSSSDKLDLDALRCIYDKGLASLTIGGVSQEAMLATFNNAEFATHAGLTGNRTNSGAAVATCTQLVCYTSDSDFPQVSATKRSPLATSITVTQATMSDPKATITVTHNDGSTFLYTIYFSAHRQPATPVITTAGNVHACCATDALTLSVSNPGNNAIQWYRFGEPITGQTSNSLNVSFESQTAASQTYEYTCRIDSSGCTATSQVYAVTVDYVTPLSSATVAPASICGAGTVTFAATTTANQVVVWKHNGIVADSAMVNAGSARTFTHTFTENDAAGIYTYECYSKNTAGSNCHSSVRSVEVTLNEIPAAPEVYSDSRCGAGEISLWVSTLDMGDSDIFRWYDSPSGGSPLATANNDGRTFTTTISQTTTFYVERYNMATGCVSARTEVEARVITSVPMPTATVTSVTLCGPDASVELEATPAPQTYILWYADADGQDVVFQGSVMHVYGSDEPSVRTFYAAGHLEGCPSERLAFTVTTNAVPDFPEVVDVDRCGAGEVTLEANGAGTIYWYATRDTDEPIATGETFTTTISQTQDFFVAARSEAGCFSGRSEVYGFVQELPQAPLTTDQSYCGAQTVTLDANSNYELSWFSDEEGTLALNSTEQAVSSTTTFYAFAIDPQTSCRSVAAPLTVTIHPVPGVPATASQVCLAGGRITLTAEPGTNATGCYWYLPTQGTVQGTTYTTRTVGTYSVSSYNEHCESESVQVVVNATPDAPVASGDERCGAGTVMLKVQNPSDAASYLWYAQAQGGEPLYTDSAFTVANLQTTTTYYVAALVNGCESPRTAVTATVNPLPAAPMVSGDMEVCYGQSTILTATLINPSATHCQWLGSPNMVTNTLTLDNIYEDIVVTVAAVDNLTYCESEAVTVTVTMNPTPDEPMVYDDTVCAGSQVVLRAEPTEPEHRVRWYASRNATTVLAEGNELRPEVLNVGTTIFYASEYNTATGCESARVPVYAVVKIMPALPVVADLSYCGTSDAQLSIAGASNDAHRWYADAQGNSLITEGNSCTIRNVAATTVFYVAANHGGCETARVPVTVTINDIPATPIAQGDTLCSAGQAQLTAVPAQGTVCRWYDIDLINVGNNGDSRSYTTESLEEGTYTYYVTSYNEETGCESQSATVNVLVAAPLSAPFTEADSICGAGTLTLGARPGSDNVECRWYLNEQLVHTGDHLVIENATNTATYFVCRHDMQSGCESQKVAVTAKVFPVFNTSFSETVCDRYTWVNDTYTESGDYTKTFYTVNGCDSVVTLHLTVNNSKTSEFDAVACDRYMWGNDTYTESGDYTKTFQTVNGCDSVVTMHLTVNRSTTAQQTLTLCSNELPVSYHTLAITEAGIYDVHIQNRNGCDSLIRLTVVVNPQPVAPVVSDVAKCGAGQSFTLRASVGENGTVCRWYSTADSRQSAAEGASLELRNVQRDTVVYVSSYNAVTGCESERVPARAVVNAIPAMPVADNQEMCGGGTFAFEVAPATETNVVFRWYPSPNAVMPIAGAGITYAPEVFQTTSYYVESYNTETQCKSDRQEVVAMVRDIPSAPSFEPYEFCGQGSVALNRPESGNYRWYATADAAEPLAGMELNTIGPVSESVTYYLSTYIDYQSIVCESTQRGALQINVYPAYQPRTLYDTVCQGVAYSNYGYSNLYEQSGDYTVTLNRISSHGCDSLVTLQLRVNPAQESRFAETVCDSYVWNGQTYTQTGIYQQTLRTVNGCDSVVTLHLTVNNSKASEFDAVACDRYTWGNDTYTETGDYTKTFQTVNGCDSVVTLHLIVNNSKASEFDAVACDQYIWQNDTYTETGDYTKTFRTVNGCDSVVTLHLTVNHPVTEQLQATICLGETYRQNGFYVAPTAAGTIVERRQISSLVTGCDSTAVLTLTVNPSYNENITLTICNNALPYTWRDTLFEDNTVSGTYTFKRQTVNGCDSIVRLSLSISHEYRETIDAHICSGTVYDANGFQESETGTYQQQLTAVNGCDSVVVLNLTVHEPAVTTLNATVCQGERYTGNGFDVLIGEAGTTQHERNLRTVNGCDSTVILTLTVHPTYSFAETAETCDNVPYVWRGHSNVTIPTVAGTYTLYDRLTTENGCDSIHKLTLTVHPTYSFSETAETCDNVPYVWRGHSNVTIPTVAGTYTLYDRLTAASGCDSIHKLTLTVHPTYSFAETAETCDNEPYVWQGHSNVNIPTVAGTYTIYDRLTTENGCDSIHKLTLTVHPTYIFAETAETCDNEPYVWQGHSNVTIPTVAGTYTIYDRLTAASGCDSIHKLTLTVHPTCIFAETAETCDNEPYVWQGHSNVTIPTVAGTYTLYDRLTAASGCDSIHKLTLTVKPVKYKDVYAEICHGDIYTFNGRIYDETGDYSATLTSSAMCDSVVTLHLTVNPVYHIDTAIYICQGALPYAFDNDHIFTQAGNYTVSLTSQSGCDSVYSIELFVTPYARLAERATVCSDELPYLFKGQSYTQSGVYEITEVQDNGCNVITTLTLTVNPSYKQYDTVTVCQNRMPYLYDANRLLSRAGNDTIHYRTVKGCDSTVIVTLFVQSNPVSSDTRYVCENELPLQYGDSTISEAGRYEVVFRRADACDSIVTLNVAVYPTYNATESLVLCRSELPYAWRDTTFMEGTSSGNYVFRRTSVNGCDSITTLALTVNSTYRIEETVEVCEGEPFVWQGHAGVNIPATPGTYTLYDNLTTAGGCDSVHVLNFTVNRAYHFEDTATAREDRPFVWQGHAGVTIPTVEGTHVVYDRLQTAEGCDSVYKLTLTVFRTFYHESSVSVCENEPYVWEGHSRIQIPTAPGTYVLYDSLLTRDGMDSVYKLTLTVNPVYYAEMSDAVCNNEPYIWQGHSNVRIPELPGNYTLYDSLTTASGCDSVFCLKLTVSPAYLISENVTVCSVETPYLWHGKSLVATGVYYDSLTAAGGCDSVYVLRLTVNPSNTYRSNDIELCQGETATWRGRTLSESGTYTDTVSNNYGCFDYYTVNVLVHSPYHIATADTVCSSELPYVWHNYTMNESGTRTVNLQTADGCDSILTFTLTVLPSYSYTENITVCATETPVVWHGRSFSASGTFYDSLATVNGCDSVYRINLVVNPNVSQADTAVVCDTQLPYVWRGRQLMASGVYIDTVPNNYGCTDRYMLNLTVNRSAVTTIMDTICQGDRYQQNGFDTLPTQYGMIYLQQRLQSAQGCDSTVNIVLTVNRNYEIPTVAATCDNVPYEWRGRHYEQAGIYYDTLQASTGCDSVFVLMLTLNPTYEVLVEDSALREHAYTNYGLDFTPMEEGDFVYTIQYYTVDGCDSIVKLTLHVAFNYGIDDLDETVQFSIYPNPATTNVHIEGRFMEEIYLYDMNGKLVAAKRADSDTNTGIYVGNLPAGYYMLRIRLTDGSTIDKKVIVRTR